MTREEAIAILQDEAYFLYEDDVPYNRQAFEMAIKALSQEPCDDAISLTKEAYSDLCLRASKADDLQRALDMEKGAYNALVKNIQCDDAISREWLMRKATERFYTTNYFNHITKMIEEAPSVTQKPIDCDDAISREWLKTAIHNFYYGLKHTPTEEDIQAYIDAAPSVMQMVEPQERSDME